MAKVVVVGAGYAGLSSALALGRAGHRVVVLERDPPPGALTPSAAFEAWKRPGVPQALLPHGFVPRGRRILLDHAPDVLAGMRDAGALEIAMSDLIPGPPQPGDADLVALFLRRPIQELVLRRVVESEPDIEIRSGIRVTGLSTAPEGGRVRVLGVRVGSASIDGDLVIDASGRRTAAWDWLRQAGVSVPETQREECGLTYYSRYFRLLPGEDYPRGPGMFGPAGELPYMAYQVHKCDARTFSVTFSIPPWDTDLKAIRAVDAWERVAEAIPAIRPWTAPTIGGAITGVLPFGGLQNVLREFAPGGEAVVDGWLPIGDSLCHTNAAYGWGLSLALVQAQALAASNLDPHAYHEAVWPEAAEYFHTSSMLDRCRSRTFRGESTDEPELEQARIFRTVLLPSVPADPAILRAVVRRNSLLDPPRAIFENQEVMSLARRNAEVLARRPGPVLGPPKDELLNMIAATA